MPVTSFLGVQLAQFASSFVSCFQSGVLCLTLLVSKQCPRVTQFRLRRPNLFLFWGLGLLLCCSQCKAAGGCGFGVCWTRVRGGWSGVMHYIRIRTVPPEYCEHKQHQMNNDMSMWPGGGAVNYLGAQKLLPQKFGHC